MGESITNKQLKQFRINFANDPATRVAQNAVTNGNLIDVALNRDLVQSIDSSFSIKLDDWKVTNQKSSGRCWLFATLNLFRPGTMKKMNVLENIRMYQNLLGIILFSYHKEDDTLFYLN